MHWDQIDFLGLARFACNSEIQAGRIPFVERVSKFIQIVLQISVIHMVKVIQKVSLGVAKFNANPRLIFLDLRHHSHFEIFTLRVLSLVLRVLDLLGLALTNLGDFFSFQPPLFNFLLFSPMLSDSTVEKNPSSNSVNPDGSYLRFGT